MPVAESNPVCTHMLRRERQPGGWLLLLLLYVFSPKTVPATVHPRIAFAGLTASQRASISGRIESTRWAMGQLLKTVSEWRERERGEAKRQLPSLLHLARNGIEDNPIRPPVRPDYFTDLNNHDAEPPPTIARLTRTCFDVGVKV